MVSIRDRDNGDENETCSNVIMKLFFSRRVSLYISSQVRESKTVLDSGFQAVNSGFQSLVGFRIP